MQPDRCQGVIDVVLEAVRLHGKKYWDVRIGHDRKAADTQAALNFGAPSDQIFKYILD